VKELKDERVKRDGEEENIDMKRKRG